MDTGSHVARSIMVWCMNVQVFNSAYTIILVIASEYMVQARQLV